MPQGDEVLFKGTVILDACCLVNLYASRRMEEIVPYLATSTVVTEFVAEQEATYVYGRTGEGGGRSRITIDLNPLINTGLVTLVTLETDGEAELFIRLAQSIDDGEAMSGAIAITRQMAIATDDRRATRVLRAHAPSITIITTPEVIKHWVDKARISESEVRTVISDIRQGAIFTIQRGHPLVEWWRGFEG